MDRRPLLGAHISGAAAVWVLRRVEGDVADAVAFYSARGRRDIASSIAEAVNELSEAARQWQAAVAADGNTETGSAAIARASNMIEGLSSSLEPSAAWVDTTAAAALLGLSERRIRQLLADGSLTGRRGGRQWLVERASITTHSTDRRLAG